MSAAPRPELDQLLGLVERAPHEFGFMQLLRRIQHLAADKPRLGDADRPAAEPLRLGQEPSMAFAPSELSRLVPGAEGRPSRLLVNFFGVLGPNGPLPLHMTEYARDRLRNVSDPTMSRFLDVFHHRMMMFLFRSWAAGQPTVSRDRPADDRFELYVGALEGLGLQALRHRDDFPDEAKLYYAGRFGPQARNADGLADIVGDYLGVPAHVQAFMRDWLDLPRESQWRLGAPHGPGRLGRSSTLGARVQTRQDRFRVVLGPLDQRAFQRLLPGGESFKQLTALVRSYVGDELRWDVRLTLRDDVDEPFILGASRLGWTTWAGRPGVVKRGSRRDDLILEPWQEERSAA